MKVTEWLIVRRMVHPWVAQTTGNRVHLEHVNAHYHNNIAVATRDTVAHQSAQCLFVVTDAINGPLN